jgi:aminodeoxyfutalosine deaminase
MQQPFAQSITIVSAPWVLPITAPAVSDGAVAMAEGKILAVGKRGDILRRYAHGLERRCSSVLMPGLVNGHCHLELSYLADSLSPPAGAPLTVWIEKLLACRRQRQASREEIAAAAITALREQGENGTVLVADIGNDDIPELRQSVPGRPEVLPMLELLAPSRAAAGAALTRLAELDDSLVAAAHAPYSTTAEVLREVKRRCRRLGQVFSVHCAESSAEVEFVRCGEGAFARFLQERGGDVEAFSFNSYGYSGSVTYFQSLDLLDSATLLVHGVHLSGEELAVVAKQGSHVCLCPGSNRFLGVGRAPLLEMLAVGILPALGTDSLASNHSLDLWREMMLLAEDHPRVEPHLILAMATVGGARALQRQADFGSLAPGLSSQMLEVDSVALQACSNAEAVYRQLVNGGRPELIRLVDGEAHKAATTL